MSTLMPAAVYWLQDYADDSVWDAKPWANRLIYEPIERLVVAMPATVRVTLGGKTYDAAVRAE